MLAGPGEQEIAGALSASERDVGAGEQGIDPAGLRRPDNSVKKTSQGSAVLGVLDIPPEGKDKFPTPPRRKEAQ